MALKKVARTEQWETSRKGAQPTPIRLVDEGGGNYTLETSGTPGAWLDQSTSDLVFTTTEPAPNDKRAIRKVGAHAFIR